MFKQIHRIPGKSVYFLVVMFNHLFPVVFVIVLRLCVCVGVCVFICVPKCFIKLSSVSPSPLSEPLEENPYRPTYIFPENYDIQMKSKGT